MITLRYPSSDREYCCYLTSFIHGPFSWTGDPSNQDIQARHRLDVLRQGASIMHERTVFNRQIYADLTVSHARQSTFANYSSMYPDRVTVLEQGSGSTVASFGWMIPNHSSRQLSSTTNYQKGVVLEGSKIVLYVVRNGGGQKPINYAIREEYSYTFDGAGNCTIKRIERHTLNYQGPTITPAWDWSAKQEAEVIANYARTYLAGGSSADATTYIGRALTAVRNTAVSIDQARSRLSQEVDKLLLAGPDLLPPKEDGELCLEAAANIPATDVNVIALLRDLKNPKELIPKLKNSSWLKNASSAYLWQKYALLPTMSDLQKLRDSFLRYSRSTPRFRVARFGDSASLFSEGATYYLDQRAKLIVDDREKGYMTLMNRIDDVGMLPTADRVWDLIPYSFCLDWIVDVGHYLQDMTAQDRLLRYDIRCVVLSHRYEALRTIQYLDQTFPFFGTIRTVSYHRRVTSHCPLPSLPTLNARLDLSSHILEAFALAVQRKR